MELVELGLAQREEDLDEQTIGRRRVGDDDGLAAARVLALRHAHLTIDLAPRLERLAHLRDVEVVRTVALVLAVDAVARVRRHLDARRLVVDQDLRLRDDDDDALLRGLRREHALRDLEVFALRDRRGRRRHALEQEDEDDRHHVEHGGDVEEVDLRLVRPAADLLAELALVGRHTGALLLCDLRCSLGHGITSPSRSSRRGRGTRAPSSRASRRACSPDRAGASPRGACAPRRWSR